MKKLSIFATATAIVAASAVSGFADEKKPAPKTADPFLSTQGEAGAETSLGIGGAGAVAAGVLGLVLVASIIEASESTTSTP